MIIKESEMLKKENVNMRGGDGVILDTVIVPKEKMIHARLIDLLTIRKGCSIGLHQHNNEVEYYYILSGEGVVTEADGDKTVAKGDVVITGWGDSHSIRNDKDEDLVFVAMISTEA